MGGAVSSFIITIRQLH